MPHFMIVLIPQSIYQFIKPFLDNKMSIFEEYGAFILCEQSVRQVNHTKYQALFLRKKNKTRAGVCKTLCPQLPDSYTA